MERVLIHRFFFFYFSSFRERLALYARFQRHEGPQTNSKPYDLSAYSLSQYGTIFWFAVFYFTVIFFGVSDYPVKMNYPDVTKWISFLHYQDTVIMTL